MTTRIRVSKEEIKPININDDVWFYVNPKSLDFVVWVEMRGMRKAAQFRILKSKLKKYL